MRTEGRAPYVMAHWMPMEGCGNTVWHEIGASLYPSENCEVGRYNSFQSCSYVHLSPLSLYSTRSMQWWNTCHSFIPFRNRATFQRLIKYREKTRLICGKQSKRINTPGSLRNWYGSDTADWALQPFCQQMSVMLVVYWTLPPLVDKSSPVLHKGRETLEQRGKEGKKRVERHMQVSLRQEMKL